MTLKSELEEWCSEVFRSAWEKREGQKVPDDDSKLGLKNEAIEIQGTVLYADMAASTDMVDTYTADFSAEIYKTFLYCAAKIVRSEGGAISAYDGDRIMAVFIGDSKNTRAVRAAMKIKWAVLHIVQPRMKAIYTKTDFVLTHVTGIDTSSLLVAKTGVRGANDLVWVGRAANHAAKLSSLSAGYTYISKDVYDVMNKSVKVSGDGNPMWESRTWTAMNNRPIYRSSWWWRID
ncbi:adenylate/guanylate cyclase domain-containing protein [Stenotrophomonas acidaminiphila]|uniref:adenylate/guanylate cyclase domain-containing protein n=1 Tax=Stenotrophomonas acidaminiphila TaxID=128780 RepID=UPI0020C6335D|nr:adenylate/guanylate cyclase domain-containing protein [Stenotrophomonas acidaminiphila]